jgi:hypothetical protein
LRWRVMDVRLTFSAPSEHMPIDRGLLMTLAAIIAKQLIV